MNCERKTGRVMLVITIAVILGLLAVVASCGKGKSPSGADGGKTALSNSGLERMLRMIDEYIPPEGTDLALFHQLRARLKESLNCKFAP